MKLKNPNVKLVEGEFYGIITPDRTLEPTDESLFEIVYNIELIKHDLPERMRYIKATSEDEYEWADRDPAITDRLTDIRGLSVRYDRIVPQREVDGYYVTDPFAGDETAKIAKKMPKNVAKAKKKMEESTGGLEEALG